MYKDNKSHKAITIVFTIIITMILALTLFTGCKWIKSIPTTITGASTTTTGK